MNTGVSAKTLMEFIAPMPCAGGRRASAFITNDENAKKAPAFNPQPRAEPNVRTTSKRSLMGHSRSGVRVTLMNDRSLTPTLTASRLCWIVIAYPIRLPVNQEQAEGEAR